MTRWRAAAGFSTAVALATAAACSSFETAPEDSADAGPDVAIDNLPILDGPTPIDAGSDAPRVARIYVYGGYTDNGGLAVAEDALSATILPDGGLGPWVATPELGSPRYFAASAFTSTGRLVFAGGSRRATDAAPLEESTKSVDTASLDPVTKLSAAAPIEFDVQSPAGASSGPWVYVVGGLSPPTITRNEVFYSSFDDNGALLQWKKTTPLTLPAGRHAVASAGGFLYSTGGGFIDDGGVKAMAQTWRAPIASDGTIGPWATTGPLPEAVTFHSLVSVRGQLFSIGGRLSAGPTANVNVATPNADGDVTWSFSTPLPIPVGAGCAVVHGDRIYVIGGFDVVSNPPHATVFIGEVGDGGGLSWSQAATGSDLPVGRAGHGCTAF